MRESGFDHPVSIAWGPGADSMSKWDEISIWVVETYGLPGDKYITDIDITDMTWFFRQDRDAAWMRLKFGALVW